MDINILVIVGITFFSSVVGLSLAAYAWRQRDSRAGTAVALVILALTWWSVFSLFRILSGHNLAAVTWFSKVELIAIVSLPVLGLDAILQFTGQEKRVNRLGWWLLWLPSILALLIGFTNELHGWYWAGAQYESIGSQTIITWEKGWANWAHTVYSYILFAFAILALLPWARENYQRMYRGQAVAIVVGMLVLWGGSVLNVMGMFKGFDLTPMAFSVTGLGLVWAAYRYRLLDLAPIARSVLIEAMQDSIIVIDRQGRIIDANEAAQKLMRFSDRHVTGRLAVEAVKTIPMERFIKTALESTDEISIGDGAEQSWYEVRHLPIADGRNKQAGKVIIVRDITARKKTEMELALRFQQQEILAVLLRLGQEDKTLDELLPKVLDDLFSIPWGSFSTKGRILLRDEASGKALVKAQKGIITPTMQEDHAYHIPILRGEKALGEMILYLRLGHEKSEDEQRFLEAVADIVAGIIEQKRAERELVVARDKAEGANRAKSQLLAKVSHELRSPLGGILGYSELLQQEKLGALNEKQKDAATKVIESTHYLTTMVNELLDEAQMEAKTLTLNVEKIAVIAILYKVETSMSVLAQQKGLEFTTSLAPGFPNTLYGDEQRLRQIITNLVGNAVKFTKTGGVEVSVERAGGSEWAIRVTDTGAGIPAEAQAYIFEPFRQVDNAVTRENRGTGLGLSITKQLVELMGGRIMLQSEVGKGSTFTVQLPLILDPEKKT